MSVPAVFDYHPVQSVDEAIALLQLYGDEAKILAGGHSLLPAMKLRLTQPEHLIDIGPIPNLAYIRKEKDAIVLGTLTRYKQIEQSEILHKYYPILPEGTALIGDQQVRNRGTIGGSVAHSDPAGDMPGIVLALKAQLVVQGANGTRTIAADDFFVDTFLTALEQDEIVTAIRLPLPAPHTGSAYAKISNKASHYAIAGCAAVLTINKKGLCTSASIAITGASTRIIRASEVEAALISKKLDDATITSASSHAVANADLISDIHGSAEYRQQMAAVITRRVIMHALERA
ncbi:FAD binding domain-containing protein [Dictyobacter arantiisoli]|uniref:Carbon monoxide dehydrogenase n=1 Tax=Dictyobacter arantiisoli TaxID=2014874 RepID=A0A5A5T8R8_9CHLR|nr:xanthine dehydrogenase family protein subunit M [Dictyobacter arantiisoli]GCF07379.1 carbon monoxide dehydrogenase [Dictyobacter arantiisoli]